MDSTQQNYKKQTNPSVEPPKTTNYTYYIIIVALVIVVIVVLFIMNKVSSSNNSNISTLVYSNNGTDTTIATGNITDFSYNNGYIIYSTPSVVTIYQIVNSTATPVNFVFSNVTDVVAFDNTVYVLDGNTLYVFSLDSPSPVVFNSSVSRIDACPDLLGMKITNLNGDASVVGDNTNENYCIDYLSPNVVTTKTWSGDITLTLN